MVFANDWNKDKSISVSFQDSVAATDTRFVKDFRAWDLTTPHPGYGKDPNIINEYGHTLYPKMIYPHGRDMPGVVVNDEDEENTALGKKVELREDGPTIEQFVEAGYPAKNYPPKGYAKKSTDEEIKAAIEKQNSKASW